MFEPRVAAASLSGESDAEWARRVASQVDAAFLGGVCLDEVSREAATAMVADRDRDEFLPEDPLAFIEGELAALSDVPVLAAFNVRSATPEPVARAAAICADRGALLEVNAHCRQAELRGAGCGETLLADADRLCAHVEAATDAGARVSVKVRAEVASVDLPETARLVGEAGADVFHVDAMDSEAVIAEVADAAPELFVIANNGVRDRETVREYLDYGADAVSLARPTDRPEVLGRVRDAADEWFAGKERAARP